MGFWRVLTIGLVWLAGAAPDAGSPDARAAATVAAMRLEEKAVLTHGIMALPFGGTAVPQEATPGAGYVAGIPRLGVPALRETDAGLGVAYVGGLRHDGATALPSGLAMGATWDPALVRAGGAMIGAEARAKGFNVMLAGGANLVRDPRGGRSFEYFGEDPLHTGLLAGAAIAGIQSAGVISTIKHFAFNDQETGRHFGNVVIGEAAARESDLLAFEIGIERGQPGAVMCAYNSVNGEPACGNKSLLDGVLKRDWGFPGWVMSDWGAVAGVGFASAGLDQQSGEQLDGAVRFGKMLADAAQSDDATRVRVDDMNRRILRSVYAVGIDKAPASMPAVDVTHDEDVARSVADSGIVLLRNAGHALPLGAGLKRIAVIGGHADAGVLSGGGSSQVVGKEGAASSIPWGNDQPGHELLVEAFQDSSPLRAIRARAQGAQVVFRNGRYLTDAVAAARQADVAIVFATQWMSEGLDVPDLTLPDGQDALIEAVAAANPHTIVVLETGGPVAMPWLAKTAGVIEAWYPGAKGGESIAAVLFGDTNPSGRLPVTFPNSVAQLPRPVLPGSDSVEPNFGGAGKPGQRLTIDYRIEGADVGYRWFARRGERSLFPFGFGLSYSHFTHDDPDVSAKGQVTAQVRVHNTGDRAGADVVQLYLVSAAGVPTLRLAGFAKVSLQPGESRNITIAAEPRVLANWDKARWHVPGGTYGFSIGQSAESLRRAVEVTLPERRWGDKEDVLF